MFTRSLRIDSSPAIIWNALTNPEQMKQWMGEPAMLLEITTEWDIGGRIQISGFHHVRFQNSGTVLQYEPYRCLSYTSLSSVSKLADIPGNYSVVSFELTPLHTETGLEITVSNFPTETIEKHMEFYWRTAIHLFKNFVLKSSSLTQ